MGKLEQKYLKPTDEHCNISLREILGKRKDISGLLAKILKVVRISILCKLIYRIIDIPMRIQINVFVEILKLILEFIWKSKGLRITKQNL